jgi:mono/diheme cytochrome c family protein
MPTEHPAPPAFETDDLDRSLDRYLTAGLVFMALLIAGFVAYRVREPDLRATAQVEQATTYTDLGSDLFTRNCASCHGKGANGGTGPALNAKEFFNATTDDQMLSIISTGVPGSEMPAWSIDHGGALTDQQVTQLVTYIRSLQPAAPSNPAWRSGTTKK